MNRDTYLLKLNGPVIPKPRPKSRIIWPGNKPRIQVYMPSHYDQWKTNAILSLGLQALDMGIPIPIDYPVRLYTLFRGKHDRSGDMVDNYPGAIADALVQAKILQDDNSLKSPGGTSDLEWSKKIAPVVWIAIAPRLSLRDSQAQLIEILDAVDAKAD